MQLEWQRVPLLFIDGVTHVCSMYWQNEVCKMFHGLRAAESPIVLLLVRRFDGETWISDKSREQECIRPCTWLEWQVQGWVEVWIHKVLSYSYTTAPWQTKASLTIWMQRVRILLLCCPPSSLFCTETTSRTCWLIVGALQERLWKQFCATLLSASCHRQDVCAREGR